MEDATGTQLVDDRISTESEPTDATQMSSTGSIVHNHVPKCKPRIIHDEDSDTSVSEDEDGGFTQQTVAESEMDDMSEEEVPSSQTYPDYESMEVGNYSKLRSEKDILVAKLLCRWWYVLPDWPPANYNYHEKLEESKLKCYSVKDFEDHENVDSSGYRKCYQLSAFPGVFRDFKGIAYDLRPIEGKPCYNNLIKKSEKELIELIKIAINKQISILSSSKYDESILISDLERELAEL